MAVSFRSVRPSSIAVFILALGLLFLAWNVHQLWILHSQGTGVRNNPCHDELQNDGRSEWKKEKSLITYIVHGKNVDSGYLKHVYKVLDYLGFVRDRSGTNSTTWDLLWAHDYPFRILQPLMHNLQGHQKVNHFPGSGYITNKRTLALSKLPFVPKSFRIPEDQEALVTYAKQNPNATFVQKSGNHRGIRFLSSGHLYRENLEGSFVQEYISRPLLIDGHKFDVGVYVILTSIQPLRVYAYLGDVLLRFCSHVYFPFDSSDRDKYVVGDDYLPFWQVPSLKKFETAGFSAKNSLDAHLRTQGKNPEEMWENVRRAVRDVLLSKEMELVAAGQQYPSLKTFFELMRFDFVLDEDLKVFLMEANMSPNLSSAHFSRNRLLYEQVLLSVLSLVGLANGKAGRVKKEVRAATKDVAVFPQKCVASTCPSCSSSIECMLCLECLPKDQAEDLKEAYREHLERRECQRLFPPPVSKEQSHAELNMEGLSEANKLMYKWYQGKCQLDANWCGS